MGWVQVLVCWVPVGVLMRVWEAKLCWMMRRWRVQWMEVSIEKGMR